MAEPEMSEVPVTSPFRAGVLEISPAWLSDLNSYKFTYSAIGIVFDALAEYLRIGVLQRFPGQAQSGALPFIGRDRKMLRGFRESDDAYVPRLRGAFETWRLAGNAQTLLTELAAYFSSNAPVLRYVVNGVDASGVVFTDWWTLENGVFSHVRRQGTGVSNWNWDNQIGQIRFWIIVYRNEGFTPWFWGDGHFWGGGQSWGFEENFTENFAFDARNIIRQWKAAGSQCLQLGGIIVTGDMSLFDPSGNGANYPNGNWDVYSNRAGIPNTFYLDGV